MAPVRRSEAVVGDAVRPLFRDRRHARPLGRGGARGARPTPTRARVVADFIAGMTDPYAEAEHARLFDGSGPVG